MQKMIAKEILNRAKSEGHRILTEFESKAILRAYGIPTTVVKLATSPEMAATFASEIGFPVVLKIVSHDITHKTEVEGVRLNLKNAAEVKKAYNEIVENVRRHKPNAGIVGLLVQKMAPQGREIIIGVSKDPQFGPIIMFGLGGIFVEVLKDVSFRLIPISEKEAASMIEDVKGYQVLKGIRGAAPADIDSLTEAIRKTSEIIVDNPEIAELEMNPLFVYEKGLIVVDARIIID
jgi:acyl-CoA synthetase (NDP forming)